MGLTQRELRLMIIQEMRKLNSQSMNESASERPVRITPQYLNRIIREEYEAHTQRQRLAEARLRREERYYYEY